MKKKKTFLIKYIRVMVVVEEDWEKAFNKDLLSLLLKRRKLAYSLFKRFCNGKILHGCPS